jgi:hypothetical protein
LLFGPAPALLLLLVTVLSPNLLAHGALLNSDVSCTLAYLWFSYQGWRFWLQPGPKNAVLLALSVLLGLLAKMSLLILPLLAMALVAARVVRGPRPLRPWLAPAVASVVLIPYAGILAAYKFDARPLNVEEMRELRRSGAFSRPILQVISVFRFLPLPLDLQRGVRSLSSY